MYKFLLRQEGIFVCLNSFSASLILFRFSYHHFTFFPFFPIVYFHSYSLYCLPPFPFHLLLRILLYFTRLSCVLTSLPFLFPLVPTIPILFIPLLSPVRIHFQSLYPTFSVCLPFPPLLTPLPFLPLLSLLLPSLSLSSFCLILLPSDS